MDNININATSRAPEPEPDFSISSSEIPPNYYLDKFLKELLRLLENQFQVDQFMLLWKKGGLKIETFEDFLREVNKFANTIDPGRGNAVEGGPLHMAFMSFMLDLMGVEVPDRPGWDTPFNNPNGEKNFGPWDGFMDFIKKNPNETPFSYFNKIFKEVFKEFCKDIKWRADDLSPFENMFLSFRLLVEYPNRSIKDANIDTYRREYFSRFPDSNEEEFQAALKKFYDKTMSEKGYFVPAFSIDDWLGELDALLPPGISQSRSRIIFELLNNFSEMVDVLQKTNIAMANVTSQFHTKMLKAYTDLIVAIPVVTIDMVKKYGGDHKNAVELSQRLSSKSLAYSEKLKSFRSLIQDEASAHSTSIEQVNQAIQQQLSIYELPLNTLLNIIRSILKS